MNLAKFMSSDTIKLDANVTTKKELLKLIATLAAKKVGSPYIKENDIYRGLLDRENLGTTAFGDMFAIPHCRLTKLETFAVGIVTIPEGIDFDSTNNKKTKLFIFIIAPEEKAKEHLLLLSHVTRFLHQKGNVQELLNVHDSHDIIGHFVEKTDIKGSYSQNRDSNLFTLIVQNENVFDDIIDVFAEIEGCTATIIDGKNANEFLYKIPLYSSFWSSTNNNFCRIILSVIKKTSTNEAISLFNEVINGLENKTGVLLTVQELMYHSGTLDI